MILTSSSDANAIEMESKYSALSTGEEGVPCPVNGPSTLKKILSLGSTIVFTALISSAITASILSTTATHPHNKISLKSHGIDSNCGYSIDEALANGCSFDMMAGKWQPPECHDSELLSEVL
jgi:hypothetical protein